MVQLRGEIKTRTKKNDKEEENQNYENNQFFGFQPMQQKVHKYIGDTRYDYETKMYVKNNQYKVTVDKDDLLFIESSIDTVGIGGDAWVI